MEQEDAVRSPSAGGGARGDQPKEKETVKVVVRCRPFSSKETNEGRKSIISIDTQAGVVGIRCPENDQVKPFTFDSVYDETTSQRQFYDESGYPLVESIFEGYNGTIFAYGQTGCGKTHTMQGRDSPPELRGVIPLSFDHIFENIQADPAKEYMVRASYLEIYNEEIRDLLADDQKKKLELKEAPDGSVYVKELTDVVVRDVDSINKVMNRGFKNRTVGATLMNEGSSRSHSIFTVVVEMGEKVGGQEHFKAGKLNLVDLAGSERQSKTGATGSRLKEGCKINLSLSALGNVISALVDGKGKHIPYRDSKLTRLLQDSLGGNTKTLMVAAISPADYNYDETLSTLRYANRAKNIKNKPIVNEDPKDAKLREYKEEIERLRKMLEVQSRGVPGVAPLSGVSTSTRPRSPPSVESTPEAISSSEREEIARVQREAAEMMEKARRMMEEAQALREQQSQPVEEAAVQQENEEQQSAGQDPSHEQSPRVGVTPAEEATPPSQDQPQPQPQQPQPQPQQTPHPPLDVVRVLSSSSLQSPKPGSAGRPASLPPIGSLQSPRPAPSDASVSPTAVAAVASPRPPVVVAAPAEDAAIARALQEAARVDAQAKAMMAQAQQLLAEAERRAQEPPQVQIIQQVVVKEVIPADHLKEKAQLHELNASMLSQKERMGQELARTQQAMEAQLREKEALHSKLRKIESQILGGASSSSSSIASAPASSAAADSEVALLQQQVAFRRAQLKLREKAKKEAQFDAARRALALEKQQVEEERKTAQETAQAALAGARKKEAKYRGKLEAARHEVADLNNEFERERENLLDTIREQTKESKLLEQLVELFLPQNELVKVWERAVWLDDKDEWQLPKIKPRSDFQKLKLPTLGAGSPTTESGGAEVASDDDGTASTVGPSSVRSVGSAAATKRPKQTTRGGHSARTEELGGPPPNQSSSPPTHRLLSPATTRLPSAVAARPPPHQHATNAPLATKREYEPQELELLPPSSSSKTGRSASREDKPRRKSKTSKSSPLPAAAAPLPLHGEPGLFFPGHPGDEDQLAPLYGDGYQPRDRLQSRQGSRQGTRTGGVLSNSSSRASLGECEPSPPVVNAFPVDKPPIGGSRDRDRESGGSGARRHRSHRPHSHSSAAAGAADSDQEEEEVVEEHSPDASLLKKSKRKKSKRRERAGQAPDPSDDGDGDLLQDLGDSFFLPRTGGSSSHSNSSSHRPRENQDR